MTQFERFTERDKYGNVVIDGVSTESIAYIYPTSEVQQDRLTDALRRLATYEETGFTPDEIPTGLELANVYCAIKKLKAYEDSGLYPEQVMKIKRERDAAIEDLQSLADCDTCMHRGNEITSSTCVECYEDRQTRGWYSRWEWRGVCEDNEEV